MWILTNSRINSELTKDFEKCEEIKNFKFGKNEVKFWFINNYEIRNSLLTTHSKKLVKLYDSQIEEVCCLVRCTWKKNLSKHSKFNLWKRRKLDCLTYNIWWSFGLTRGNFYINFWSRFIIFVFTHFERFVRFSFKESQMSWQNWSNMWITRNSLELSPKTKLWKKVINLTWNLVVSSQNLSIFTNLLLC